MKEFEIVYSSKSGFSKKELPGPKTDLEPTEVLIRPQSVGVCGSDLHNVNQYSGDELRIGHEWVGSVESSGSKSIFNKGDLVSSTALLGCGNCSACKSGDSNHCERPTVLGSEKLGMLRSWAILSDHQLIKMPQLDSASNSLLEVAAVGDEAISHLEKMTNEKENLLIIGAGPVGLMTAFSAKKQGYNYELIETVKERVKRAQDMGLNVSSLGVSLLDQSNEKKFSMVIDCSGDNGGQSGGFKYLPFFCAKKCSVVLVGKYSKPQEINLEHFSNLTAKFHWMRGMKNQSYSKTVGNWESSIKKISESVITHQFTCDQVNEAFKMAMDSKQSLKVLINF